MLAEMNFSLFCSKYLFNILFSLLNLEIEAQKGKLGVYFLVFKIFSHILICGL